MTTRFCPTCAQWHDFDLGCMDVTGQVLRDAGMSRWVPAKNVGAGDASSWNIFIYVAIVAAALLLAALFISFH